MNKGERQRIKLKHRKKKVLPYYGSKKDLKFCLYEYCPEWKKNNNPEWWYRRKHPYIVTTYSQRKDWKILLHYKQSGITIVNCNQDPDAQWTRIRHLMELHGETYDIKIVDGSFADWLVAERVDMNKILEIVSVQDVVTSRDTRVLAWRHTNRDQGHIKARRNDEERRQRLVKFVVVVEHPQGEKQYASPMTYRRSNKTNRHKRRKRRKRRSMYKGHRNRYKEMLNSTSLWKTDKAEININNTNLELPKLI